MVPTYPFQSPISIARKRVKPEEIYKRYVIRQTERHRFNGSAPLCLFTKNASTLSSSGAPLLPVTLLQLL